MSTGTIIIISLSNLMILVLTTVFPYTFSLMKKQALKNGVQLPENYDEKINKKQTLLSIILRYAIGNVYRCNIINYVFMKDCINTMCNPFYQ